VLKKRLPQCCFKRDLAYMRERLNAPIVWDREAGGYRFAATQPGGPAYALPGLWFSADELYAFCAVNERGCPVA
jgi:predicted DNA-binding transcriptional regulator YafY